ncbi:MAG TPA: dienelactone hydrolase family protein [Vicinamibacterales bacterium]|nr:dienelactone hydrolase family protein [Vicinamibacterales bacterium]
MGERITFKANGTMTPGYLARPASPGPGVIVIQEWWGLVPHIENVADRFAAEGFVALAPDLFHGRTAKSPDEAGKLMMSLRIEEAARDLAAAIDALAARPEVTGSAVGTIGFCMGGALSLFAACRNSKVGACVVFYGGHPNVKPDLPALQSAVLGIFAGKDTFVTPQVVADLDRRLTELGKAHSFHTYPDAAHAFFNDDRPEVYDRRAASDAWAKTLAFLRRELHA